MKRTRFDYVRLSVLIKVSTAIYLAYHESGLLMFKSEVCDW